MHHIRGELGRALRAARERRALAHVEWPTYVWPRRRRPWARLVVLGLVAGAIASFALFGPRLTLPGGGEPAPAVQEPRPEPAVTLAPLSRGVSISPLELANATPTPVATARPTFTPRPTASAGVPSGTGEGGAGGGPGTSPGPVAITETLYYGHVVNEKGDPLEGVCVSVGTRSCSEFPVITDKVGFFKVLLPAPSRWDFKFVYAGFETGFRRGITAGTEPTSNVGYIQMVPCAPGSTAEGCAKP